MMVLQFRSSLVSQSVSQLTIVQRRDRQLVQRLEAGASLHIDTERFSVLSERLDVEHHLLSYSLLLTPVLFLWCSPKERKCGLFPLLEFPQRLFLLPHRRHIEYVFLHHGFEHLFTVGSHEFLLRGSTRANPGFYPKVGADWSQNPRYKEAWFRRRPFVRHGAELQRHGAHRL